MAGNITIDPGVLGTGYAIWSPAWELLEWGIVTAPKDIAFEQRCNLIYLRIKQICREHHISRAWIEFPAMFSSQGGMVTARSGALVKLTYLAGQISGSLYPPTPCKPVTVNEWKGQLPKSVVEKRVRETIDVLGAKSHAIDAIGIGLYVSGRFK